jgi:hypothetical protein
MTKASSAFAPARRSGARLLVPAALAAVATVVAAPARAGDAAAAEALFQTAKGLMEQKNYAAACPKFEASYKLDPAVGTLLNLADCHEKQGLLAHAWAEWGDARDQAKREGDAARADLANRRQTGLTPRVPKLTVNVKGSVAGLSVYRDDVNMDPATFGVPLPVDPGPHAITLRRGPQVLKESKVESKEKGSDEVTLDATDVPPPPPEPAIRPLPGTMPPAKVEYVRKSKGMMAGGIVMSVIGGPCLLGGLIWLAADKQKGPPAVFSLFSAGLLGGGIAMAVIGSKKVPKEPQTGLAPTLVVGPTWMGVQSTF